MLLATFLLLTAAQDSAPDRFSIDLDPRAMLRSATVVLPTRRPAFDHLDEVFELPRKIEPEPVYLRDGVEPSEASTPVPADAVAIVPGEGRPVDFEIGAGPVDVHVEELDCTRCWERPLLETTVALGGPVVVDLPWDRSASGIATFPISAYSGRVVDAWGTPLAGIELQVTQLGAAKEPSSLTVVGTTGADGKWERERVEAILCGSPSAPDPPPVTPFVALRTHASHAWQVFPYHDGGTVFLGEPALLSVYVVNEDGEPVDESDLRLGPATAIAPGLLDLPGPVAPDVEVTLRDFGGWEVPDLPRGVYRVYARAPGHTPAAALIDLSSGHRELMLTLPRAEVFAVTVLDVDGKPAVGVSATLHAADVDVPVDGGVTDAAGELLIDRAPSAGPLVLRARHPRLGTAEISWEYGPREVTLTLSGTPPPPRTTGTWGALYDRLFAE